MAALNRPVTASYEVHETVRADTQDDEDHTFCGIMFPIKARAILPVERVIIHSVAVRGQLGDLTVWVSNENVSGSGNDGNHYTFRLNPRRWTKVYEKFHAPSRRKYDVLDLSKNPIVMTPGQVRAIYIHSTLPGDEAIVYDNSHFGNIPRRNAAVRYEDDCISIYSGKAHLSCTPFGQIPIWGWGNAWRDRREFVGQIQYGTVYKLWNPERHITFGSGFSKATIAMLLCQRRFESPVSMLPDECVYYILNMCRWDWFGDTSNEIRAQKRARRIRIRQEVEQEALERTQITANYETNSTADNCKMEYSSTPCCDVNKDVDNDEGNDDDDDDDDDDDFVIDDDNEDNDNENNNDEIDHDEDSEDEDGDSNLNEDDVMEDSDDDDDDDEDHGYRADAFAFTYHDVSSDEEESETSNNAMNTDTVSLRQSWFRTQFHRIHILRALSHGGA